MQVLDGMENLTTITAAAAAAAAATKQRAKNPKYGQCYGRCTSDLREVI